MIRQCARRHCHGSDHLLKIAMGRIKNRSINRNCMIVNLPSLRRVTEELACRSPRLEAEVYRKLTVVNCIAEYRLIYLKQEKLVTSAARPSL